MKEQLLTDAQKDKIQNRVRHYLERNREASNHTQAQMAKRLGYSLSAYRDFEREGMTENRLHNAIEIIAKFAEIEEMSPSDFMAFLTLGTLPEKEGVENLRKWEKELIQTLRHCDQAMRKSWSEAIMRFPKKDLVFLLKAQTMLTKIADKQILTSLAMVLAKVKA